MLPLTVDSLLSFGAARTARDRLFQIALRAVGEDLGQGWILTDAGGSIVMANHTAEAMLGWNPDQFLGQSCRGLLRCLDANAVDQYRPSCRNACIVSSGDPMRRMVRTAKRSRLKVSARSYQLFADDGASCGALCTFSSKLDEGLSDRTSAQFLSNVSHELRTPLSALVTTIEFLSSTYQRMPSQDMGRMLYSLHHTALQLHNLVENLLSASSVGLGCFTVHPCPSDLKEIIGRATAFVQPLMERKQQRLRKRVPNAVPLIMADPQRIMQVLINLLSNASKYGPSGDEIVLAVANHPRQIVIKVSEHGPGIPASEQQRIFERFYRRRQVDPYGPKGIGLGLAIVKSIVVAHGGQVGLRSTLGHGSTFWFSVPIAAHATSLTVSEELQGEGGAQ